MNKGAWLFLGFIIVTHLAHGTLRHGRVDERLDALDGKMESVNSNMLAMVQFDSAVAQGIKQNAASLQQAAQRFSMQDAFHSRALVEEMGEKDYKREMEKFMAELQKAREAAQTNAPPRQ